MNKSTKTIIMAAAISGLYLGGLALKSYGATGTSAGHEDKTSKDSCKGKDGCKGKDDGKSHDCKGKNDCKGKGGCSAGDNGCKGKNSCKGKGGCATKSDDTKKG
ncbi:MAG TPA: hypothetical protein VL200_09145 [Lacunisphaera sp.]|jgi:hypothetical protein|nr:hypothetical protein [Lacunisphaera sp.]